MTEKQIEKRLEPIRSDIADLKTDLETLKHTPATPPASPRRGWFTRNAAWFYPLIIMAPLTLITTFLPRLLDHSAAALDSKIDNHVEQKFKDHHLDEMNGSLRELQGQVKGIADNVNLLLGRSIKQAALLPPQALKLQLPQISSVLNAAIRAKSPIGLEDIRRLHDALAPLVIGDDPGAWDATVLLASYRSVFNTSPISSLNVTLIAPPLSGASNYRVPPAPGESGPDISAAGLPVTKDTGAVFQSLGEDINPNALATNAYIELHGGSVLLDGSDIRNVIFIGVHVVYNGGPVKLEHVTFIDCQFSVRKSKDGELFASKSTSEERVDLTVTG